MDKLLQRSAAYHEFVSRMLEFPPFDQSARPRCSRILCGVSIEHSESAKILLTTGNFTSSLAVLRVQYEALVRAIWMFYAASEAEVERLSGELSEATARKADRLPMLSRMLKEIEGTAPKNALDPLLEFKEYSWRPLSSYIHGGIHAIDRHSKGYPRALLEQTLKASNGLNAITGYFLTILAGNLSLMQEIIQSFSTYADCLPVWKSIAE